LTLLRAVRRAASWAEVIAVQSASRTFGRFTVPANRKAARAVARLRLRAAGAARAAFRAFC
jgi:hypothetical protein